MWWIAQLPQKRWLGLATQPSVSLVRSLKNPSPTSPTAASGMASSELFIGADLRLSVGTQGPLDRAVLVGLRLGRGEELGDDLDREDAGDAAVVVDHGRVHRLALQQ